MTVDARDDLSLALNEVKPRTRPDIPDEIAHELRALVASTTVSRAAVLTSTPEEAFQIAVQRVSENLSTYLSTGDWQDRELSRIERIARLLDEGDITRAEARELSERR